MANAPTARLLPDLRGRAAAVAGAGVRARNRAGARAGASRQSPAWPYVIRKGKRTNENFPIIADTQSSSAAAAT